ncbi:MAG TPA: alginate lyase family protein [Candidatus Sumerlaeota bacterium]|nr:alginate lyase family protein [Candidatus Sumerlaeota bacterium]
MLLRLVRTLRFLQTRQVVARVKGRLRSLWLSPECFSKREVPACPGPKWREGREFLPPGPSGNSRVREALLGGEFRFLNQTHKTGWPPDWEANGPSRLWLYNLHYFDWIWPLSYEEGRVAAQDWIARHDLRKGRVGWEPYPVSLRLMNWCGFFFGRHATQIKADPGFRDLLWRSLFGQAEWLSCHLETHLLANHFLENGAALTFAETCFEGVAGERWRRMGLEILREQIPEQILPDGMHFERSPMYHCRMVYLFLLLAQTGDAEVQAQVLKPLERMLRALRRLYHPDGQIALFNDSAFGIYNDPVELLAVGEAFLKDSGLSSGDSPETPEPAVWALPDAGYYGGGSPDGKNYLICDAGPIGPDYNAGHAHGDLLSFELTFRGHRVVVDAGVYDYETGEMRQYARSTAAHNTVELEGLDQCEFWGGFRVARRAHPRDVAWTPETEGFHLEAWHDGYERLPGCPRHRRVFDWQAPGRLEVQDRIEGGENMRAVSRIHLHPDCRVEKREGLEAWVAFPGGRVRFSFQGQGCLTLKKSWYCPEFGIRIENACLSYEAVPGERQFAFELKLL